jgi:hypothetical protein
MVDGLAVDHRSGAARIVGDHAADRGPARRRHIGREAEVVRLERGVQLVEHDAGLHACGACLGIDGQDAVEILRGIEHQAGADRLARLRGAAPARRQRHAVAPGHGDRPHHVLR